MLVLQVVAVEAPDAAMVLDTTGAGDAFLGGLICGEFIERRRRKNN